MTGTAILKCDKGLDRAVPVFPLFPLKLVGGTIPASLPEWIAACYCLAVGLRSDGITGSSSAASRQTAVGRNLHGDSNPAR